MGVYNATIVTNAGVTLISQALVGNITLNFTNFKLSSHQYPSGTDFAALTDMQDIQLTNEPTSITQAPPSQVNVLGFFENTSVTTAFQIWNIGLYAQSVPKDGSPAGPETLFAISSATQPDTFPAGGDAATLLPKFIFEISDTADITINVNPAGSATAADIEEVKALINLRAPIPHVDNNGIYGKATTSQYGHVVLSNNPAENDPDKVPSSAALYQVYSSATPTVYQGSLSASGWVGTSAPYTQSVAVSGVTAADSPTIDINPTGLSAVVIIEVLAAWGNAGITATTAANQINFSAYGAKPDVDINFIAKV